MSTQAQWAWDRERARAGSVPRIARRLIEGKKINLIIAVARAGGGQTRGSSERSRFWLMRRMVKSVVVWASVGSVAVAAGNGAGEGAWAQVRACLAREAGLE